MTGAIMTNQEKYDYLRNDIFHLWLKHPGLTTIETIDLLRKQKLLNRPQKGLKEYLDEIRIDFDGINYVDGDGLPKDDTPPGANPFMSNFNSRDLPRFQ